MIFSTIAHLSAVFASLWLTLYMFQTLQILVLGMAALSLLAMWIIFTIAAILDDIDSDRSRREAAE